ncbi:MAG TPA: arylsulfatase, partial [Methyloceanibacter sp.]|nr:arylsulfatase [Methyloceanibacter sp.]
MDHDKDPETTNQQQEHGLDRRSMLLSGVSLFALSMVGSDKAGAQAQPAPKPSGSSAQPNILFIMGDDIGW